MRWTPEQEEFLTLNYPVKGKAFCMEYLGMSDAQIRAKASRLGLKARGVSEAWHAKNAEHAQKLKGRKRPDQSAVMLAMFADGRISRERTEAQRAAVSASTKTSIEKNGHPRGSLGMKHTEATKEIVRHKALAAWANMPDDKRQAKIMKMMQSRVENGTYAPARFGTTWKAAWRDIGGSKKFYRSKWEANYAYYLEWLKQNGKIADWKHEPKTFWFAGVKRGTVSYLPDFWVFENDGSDSFHEVKGWMDDRSKTKIMRMAKYYPGVKLVVIDSKGYAALKRSVQGLVPGWEE